MVLVHWIRWFETRLPAQFLWRDRRGVTSVEYVIIAIIITVAVLGGLSRVGGYLSGDFNNVSIEL